MFSLVPRNALLTVMVILNDRNLDENKKKFILKFLTCFKVRSPLINWHHYSFCYVTKKREQQQQQTIRQMALSFASDRNMSEECRRRHFIIVPVPIDLNGFLHERGNVRDTADCVKNEGERSLCLTAHLQLSGTTRFSGNKNSITPIKIEKEIIIFKSDFLIKCWGRRFDSWSRRQERILVFFLYGYKEENFSRNLPVRSIKVHRRMIHQQLRWCCACACIHFFYISKREFFFLSFFLLFHFFFGFVIRWCPPTNRLPHAHSRATLPTRRGGREREREKKKSKTARGGIVRPAGGRTWKSVDRQLSYGIHALFSVLPSLPFSSGTLFFFLQLLFMCRPCCVRVVVQVHQVLDNLLASQQFPIGDGLRQKVNFCLSFNHARLLYLLFALKKCGKGIT